MPPRHGKSELVSRRLPAFLHGLYPDTEIMAASYLDTLAGEMCVAVQNIIDSKEYQEVFPETRIFPWGTKYTEGTRNSSEHHIVGHRGKYRGQGVGGSFTGKGANFIIVDDPIKGREIADSETFRDRLWRFWLDDLYSRRETDLKTGREGQVLITQTRWHEDDLSGRLLDLMSRDKNAIQFTVLKYPAVRVDNDDPTDPREIGEALWPKKYNVKQLNEIKATVSNEMGPRGWSSLYQQDPIPDGGGVFAKEMFQLVNIELTQQFDWKFIVGDTAYKEKQESDFHSFTAFGVIGDDLYILENIMAQMKASQVEHWAEPFIRRHLCYGYRGTWIEPKGHGIYLNQKWALTDLMVPSDTDIEEFYKDRKFDKVERANNATPHLAHRTLKVNKNIPNKEELMAQCLGFPKVKHDDFVDNVIDAIKIKWGKNSVSILDVL